ncbi:MAG TPA: YbaN family protein [Longimicrobiales bacterium]|nr:YbaN family protein [Longimicrobiales bacterium]
MSQECPVDHEAAERALGRLPGSVRRGVYLGTGWAAVALGLIGIAVPLLPTTCFLLLAGWCFARSSPRAERWLHENRLFGRYLRDYRERGIVSVRVRRTTLAVLWGVIGASAFFFAERLWVVALLLLVAVAVTVHLYTLPTEPRLSSDRV